MTNMIERLSLRIAANHEGETTGPPEPVNRRRFLHRAAKVAAGAAGAAATLRLAEDSASARDPYGCDAYVCSAPYNCSAPGYAPYCAYCYITRDGIRYRCLCRYCVNSYKETYGSCAYLYCQYA